MVLDTCPNFVQLDVAQFTDGAAGFFAEDHKKNPGFSQIFPDCFRV